MVLNASPPDIAEYGDLRILFIMATEQEYGAELQARIKPVITGVGPVEAGVGAAWALGELDRVGALPDLVCSLGTAGSASLDHAGIYQVSSVSYRDMDASALGFEKGVTPFTDEPAKIEIPYRIPDVAAASISTGGGVITGDAYDAIDADMVDMETFSVFRAAHSCHVPMIGLRGISDGRSDLTGLHDWLEFLHILDEKLARTLDDLRDHITEGRFHL